MPVLGSLVGATLVSFFAYYLQRACVATVGFENEIDRDSML
ncbi:hypothetical protein Gotri_023213, partial [Gossypium trilobum]|nr:hypothetical protein [Gossypium trilobum]